MAKAKTSYTCSACGAQFPQWAGQCSDCGGWNTLTESVLLPAGPVRRYSGYTGKAAAGVTPLSAVTTGAQLRHSVGLQELDRVLGGGLVTGSVVLLGGDPGIGKSTLLLQVLSALDGVLGALYVTGEESPEQISLRATRLGIDHGDIRLLSETAVEQIIATAMECGARDGQEKTPRS